MIQDKVWVEKYRPQEIENVILSDKEKEYFLNITNVPNNLLFVGQPGSGKTTLAKILVKKFAPNSYLYINASEQSGIDIVRNEISQFISTVSLDGNQKIIILDEVDGISLAAQQCLRGMMEEYLDSVKFILTANFKHKLIEAICSRCQEFEFEATEKQIMQRIVFILKQENVTVPADQKNNIRSIVKNYYPDIRKTINELQRCCMSGTFVFAESQDSNFSQEVYDKLKNKEGIFDIRRYIVDNTDKFNNDYHFLMRGLFDIYIAESNNVGILLVADYMYKHAFVLDTEVNFTSLLLNLKNKIYA